MKKIKKYIIDLLFKIFLSIFSKKTNKKKIYFPYQAKILIINFGDIQQTLTITPLVIILRENFNSQISLLTNKENAEVFKNNKYVSESIIYSKFEKNFWSMKVNLWKEKYDVLIEASEKDDYFSSFCTGLNFAKNKVGFIKKNRKLFSHKLQLLEKNKIHAVDRYLSLLEPFEMNFDKTNLNIHYPTSEKSKQVIEKYLITHDLLHKFTVVVNVSNKHEIGFWGVDSYKSLLKYLRNYDINIIIASNIEDIEIAEKIADKSNLIFYNSELDSYAELLKNVNFIFTPDSFTVQLAAAFKVPTFCLFVQHKVAEMINVPYNSDFDFALTEKDNLKNISYGKVLNGFVPYFEYVYERYCKNSTN